MKILHIINRLGGGGAERLVSEMLPIINKKEEKVIDILTITDNKMEFAKKLTDNGIKVDTIPLRNLYNPINVYHIKKYIIDGKYDIVHAHLFPTIYWTSIAARLIFKNRPKFVITEHSTHNRRREKGYLRWLEKFIYYGYDKIISISQRTQSNLISWLKPKQSKLDKFIIIENGIDVDKFKNAKPYRKSEIRSKFTEDTNLLCMVGRFSEAKDQPTLIKAMRYLAEDVHLLLVGIGPLKEDNQKLAKKIGVNHKVHFLGFRDDVERILKTVDIVILSSNWEGFGLAAVEGMAAGKPVIASDIDGLREVVEGAGILFERGNETELANKINSLIKDADKKNYRIQRSLVKANLFTVSRLVDNHISLYNRII